AFTTSNVVAVNVQPAINFYADADMDGYGNPTIFVIGCSAPSGYVGNADDCNDNNAAIHPGASETCNLIDDDCDLQTDEGVQLVFYADSDNDGYGNNAISAMACSAPAGYVTDNTDCDDGNAAINPAEVETCNGFDDNCNGFVDEGLTFVTYFRDFDT